MNQFQRVKISGLFSIVLDKYHLPTFRHEGEEGLTYVTQILCHAGLPLASLDAYFLAMNNTVNDAFYDDFDMVQVTVQNTLFYYDFHRLKPLIHKGCGLFYIFRKSSF